MATTAAKEVGGGGGREGVEDVEEGEISDTASVEEISEEDFNKHGEEPEVTVVKETPATTTTKRVWTMSDLYKYQMMGKGYVSGLYNLAWAQGALNKPLNELLVEVVDPAEAAKRSSPASSSSSVGGEKKVEKVVIDDDSGGEDDVKIVDVEREEGELEEGEIDLDSEGPAGVREGGGDGMHVDGGGVEGKKVGLEERVKSVREALESVTVVEVEQSFEAGCAKVQMVLENLRELVQENDVPGKDALVQLLITAVQAVNSVFNSMNRNLKEKNKEIFSRLLSLVNSYYSTRFSPEQIKELEMMVISVDASDTLPSTKLGETEREREGFIAMNDNDDKDTLAKSAVHPVLTDNLFASVEPFAQNKVNTLVEASKSGVSSFRSRGPLPPLLDLHKDHDLDSLPSPTRESAPSLPVQRVPPVGDEISKFVSPLPKVDASESRMHPYETDAVKAVSSYQQRFGRSSFFMADRLPSPTPSEDSADGDGDSGGEISSSSSAGNSNPPVFGKSVVSPPVPGPEGSGLAGVIPAKNTLPMSSVSSLNVKPSAKSRDPRLRFMNSDLSTLGQNHSSLPTLNNMPKLEPRKNKALDDPPMDGPSLKRHRIASESSLMDMKAVNESGGWLEDSDMIVPPTRNGNNLGRNAVSDPRRVDNGAPFPVTSSVTPQASVSVNEHVPVPVIGTIGASRQVLVAGTAVTSLPELLKNIAVNPTMLMNILKMGQQQQKLASEDNNITDPAKNSTLPLSSSSIVAAGHVSTVAPSQPAILPRPAIMPQPSQSDSADEVGKIRMKPRDPRRVLHNNTQQRTGNVGPDPLKSNVTPLSTAPVIKDNQIVQKQEGFADTKLTPSQPSALPDISSSFTKSLKNLADIVSVSQGSSTQPLVSQNPASQPMPVRADRLDGKVVSSNAEQTKGTVSTPELAAAAAAHSQSTWAEVEHLFERYDDQQKAAIQRERARRIEEQKKMFAVQKLCLVLDLDHTLLNSAKFAEVDPVHDEILRKKEEQDREKPYRHLFRFPHMGMWTKLRPGIWNFLERASKLYELHLYTMGNKLYATEMAKVLDPKGVLFAGRVISRGDDGDPFDSDERVPKSKDLEGVLGMESSVVIIDDSVRVWPHNKLNLIVVERYIYFPCSRRQFGLPGPSLLEIDHDERPEDGTLACSLAVIEKIHQNFYNHQSLEEADVRNILALEQRKILAGCRIVFSRVFPVGEANPHLHPLWQTAEQFGAVCTNQIDEQVTHVVANSLGTDKVNWALSNEKFVVHPGWVEASALLYRRANEQDFAIKP